MDEAEEPDPELAPTQPGDVVVERVPLDVAVLLLSIPDLIDADTRPEIRSLLFPEPFDDEARNDEWRRMAHPELAHLFASARELVSQDLIGFRATLAQPSGARLVIPRAHRHAWLSALQQSVQIVRGHHGFTSAELNSEDLFDEATAEEMSPERLEALWSVHTLYMFQSILIDAETAGGFPPAVSP